jgi:hypothetical protein
MNWKASPNLILMMGAKAVKKTKSVTLPFQGTCNFGPF